MHPHEIAEITAHATRLFDTLISRYACSSSTASRRVSAALLALHPDLSADEISMVMEAVTPARRA